MIRLRAFELPAFLLLAGTAHLAALTLLDLPGGGASGGEGGTSEISLQASPDLQSLADSWDRPPEAAPDTVALATPEGADVPDLPQPATDAAPTRRNAQPLDAAPTDPLPQLDSRLPAPPGLAPASPDAPRMPMPSVETAPRRAAPLAMPTPQRPAPTLARPKAEALPQADTAPPPPRAPKFAEDTSPQAPATSRRPVTRPDDLAPPVAKAAPATQPKPKAKPAASAPQPARKAAGAGGGAQAAPATPKPKAAGASAGQVANARAKWGAGIERAAQKAHRSARGTSARGIVVLQIKVAANGALVSASIARSSGNGVLDRAALQNIRRARFPKAPAGAGDKPWSGQLRANFD